MNITKENCIKLWNDQDGTHIFIGDDSDGLDCLEVRYVDQNGNIYARLTFLPEQAKMVGEALIELAKKKFLTT